jgi:peptidyl-tRNA hydrolase
MEAADYVLQDFSTAERELLEPTLDRAVEAVFTFVCEGLESAMNKYNPLGDGKD